MSPEPHWAGRDRGQDDQGGSGSGESFPSWWQVDEQQFVMTPTLPSTTPLDAAPFQIHSDGDLADNGGALFYVDAHVQGEHLEFMLSGDYQGFILGNTNFAYLKADPWTVALKTVGDGSAVIGNPSGEGISVSGNGSTFNTAGGSNGLAISASGTSVIKVKSEGPTPKLGFFDTPPAAKPTGVAVTAEGIHAALVALGLIGA